MFKLIVILFIFFFTLSCANEIKNTKYLSKIKSKDQVDNILKYIKLKNNEINFSLNFSPMTLDTLTGVVSKKIVVVIEDSIFNDFLSLNKSDEIRLFEFIHNEEFDIALHLLLAGKYGTDSTYGGFQLKEDSLKNEWRVNFKLKNIQHWTSIIGA